MVVSAVTHIVAGVASGGKHRLSVVTLMVPKPGLEVA